MPPSEKKAWPMVRLGDVCEVVLGGTPSTKNPAYWNGTVPWLTPGDMGKVRGIFVGTTTRTLTSLGLSAGSTLFPANSVIVSTRAPIGYVLINRLPMSTNQGCKTLVPKAGILPEYLCHNLRGRVEELNALGTGTTFKELSTGNLKNLLIPLPPLPVQREIVARLEKELAEADSLAANFKRIAELADAEFMTGLEETFERVEGEKVRLGNLGRVAMCKRVLKNQTSETGDIPFFKIGTFGKKADAFISQELFDDFSSHYSYPSKGDILISAAGTLGRTVVFDGTPSYYQDSNIVWLKHGGSRLLNPYLQYFYRTKPWEVSVGVTIPRIYNGDIERTEIPLPPLSTQRAIVAKLDAAKAHCDKLTAAAERGLRGAEKLRAAILMEAFER